MNEVVSQREARPKKELTKGPTHPKCPPQIPGLSLIQIILWEMENMVQLLWEERRGHPHYCLRPPKGERREFSPRHPQKGGGNARVRRPPVAEMSLSVSRERPLGFRAMGLLRQQQGFVVYNQSSGTWVEWNCVPSNLRGTASEAKGSGQ
jgi:hypothetical protein